jgi:glycosyltransferase involved in cell wall biosynthesis
VKPVLFLTGNVPAYRAGALAQLNELEGIEVALFGGPSLHAGPAGPAELPFPHRRISPGGAFGLARSGDYRGVICSTGGRLALLGGWAGARRARLPLILWASLWAHPRSAAHALSYPALRRLYRSADAVVTYGPHVSAYVTARGARNVHIAPQSVDNGFWRSAEVSPPAVAGWPAEARMRFLFVGRDGPGKGLEVLRSAWAQTRLDPGQAALILAGPGPGASSASGPLELGPLDPEGLRDVYAASDVLVVPSVPTPRFREPWGLVVNEAMNRSLAVIASDGVGAAAGGLVGDGETGLLVPAGDSAALAAAIVRLADDPGLRERLGQAGAQAVLAYSHEAWAAGFSRALATVGLSRGHW